MTFALVKSKGPASLKLPGPITGDGKVLTTRQLRDGIPAGTLLALQIEAALTGKLKRIDLLTGEEVEVAEQVPMNERLKIIDKLVDKRLPAAKTTEIEDQGKADLSDIPLDAEEIKRMPISQLGRVIEAQFENVPPTPTFTEEQLYESGIRPRDPAPSTPVQDGGAGAEDSGTGTDFPNGDGE